MALGYMRRHRRWLYAFLWIVILGFIVFYIPAFQGVDTGSPGEKLGAVGGLPITAGEFQRAYLQRRQLYERLYQGKLDAAALKSMGLEEQVFDSLVAERLLALEARRLGLRVTDDELARSLTSAPDLQENGRFIGADELRRRVQFQGLTLAEFEDARRSQLLVEKLESLVAGGVTVLPAEVDREFRRRTEQVRLEYVLADAARFRGDAVVSDDEVRARYESRKDSYRLPERRVASYVLIDPESLRARASVTDADIEGYYQEHRDEFLQPEQVCASHILIKVKASPDAKEGHGEAEAKALAEGLLARLKAGADFAALAEKSSEDKGSASGGGDLGCFGRGRMVPEFDAAAFALEIGETSDLVKTGFGFHVIRVTSRQQEEVRPLGQVREAVRATLASQRVQALARGQAEAVSEAVRKGRSLEQAAQAEGLTPQKSPPLAIGDSVEPLASPALVARLFELKPGEVAKEPLAVPKGLAFVALAEVQPPHVPDLAGARDRVKADLLREKSLERARLLAADVRQRAQKLGLEKAAAALGLVRKETPSLVGRGQPLGELGTGAALEEAAYALEENVISPPVRTSDGYAVLRVLERKPFDAREFEKQKTAIVASLREAKRNQFFQAYMNAARQRFSVERRPEVFSRVAG